MKKKEEVTKPLPKIPVKQPQASVKPMRQIILETDGNKIKIVKAEVSGSIELQAILMMTLESLAKDGK